MGLELDAMIVGVAASVADMFFVQRAKRGIDLGRGNFGPRPLPEQFIAYF